MNGFLAESMRMEARFSNYFEDPTSEPDAEIIYEEGYRRVVKLRDILNGNEWMREIDEEGNPVTFNA